MSLTLVPPCETRWRNRAPEGKSWSSDALQLLLFKLVDKKMDFLLNPQKYKSTELCFSIRSTAGRRELHVLFFPSCCGSIFELFLLIICPFPEGLSSPVHALTWAYTQPFPLIQSESECVGSSLSLCQRGSVRQAHTIVTPSPSIHTCFFSISQVKHPSHAHPQTHPPTYTRAEIWHDKTAHTQLLAQLTPPAHWLSDWALRDVTLFPHRVHPFLKSLYLLVSLPHRSISRIPVQNSCLFEEMPQCYS